jgi:hypothetical protein
MPVYIQGSSCISPQPTFLSQPPFSAVNYDSAWLPCIEPVYKEHINPTLARRLSRYIKMGVTTALTALKEAGVEMPGAIITGTGLGSTEDNEKILMAMHEHQERMINPTHFIQSTHNTISSQIAIMLKCHQYNNTYVHRGFSFESALFDGMLLIAEGKAETALVGGVDAITEGHYVNYARIHRWKANTMGSLNMIQHPSHGSIPGEGAAYFLLAKQPAANSSACIRAIEMIYKPGESRIISERCNAMLEANGLQASDIDLLLLGNCGDSDNDFYYDEFRNHFPESASTAYFKHLCGEYEVAGSFALWLAAGLLKTGQFPEGILQTAKPGKLKHILLYNHHRGDQHTLFLLSAC